MGVLFLMKLHDFGSWWLLRYSEEKQECVNVLDLSLLSIKEELYWFDQMSYTRGDVRVDSLSSYHTQNYTNINIYHYESF
jgi:hypothetical protein